MIAAARAEPAFETRCAQAAVLVTLEVGGQLCGIPVERVRDVLCEQAMTRIPLSAPEIAGNLNLRGRIVTAIDLRSCLGLPPAPPGSPRMAIVTEHGANLYALIVDQVSAVATLDQMTFEPTPASLAGRWGRFSSGLHRLPDRLLVVLDTERLLASPTAEAQPS